MSTAPTPQGGSDLPTRFAAGVAMIALALLATWFGGWPFRLLVAAAAAAMLWEWGEMHRVARLWTWTGIVLLCAGLLAGMEALYPAAFDSAVMLGEEVPVIDADTFADAWPAFGGIALLALLMGAISRRLAMIGGVLYIGIPAFALLVIDWAWFPVVIWLFIVTWSADIFAYFAGRSIGGPKLAPRVSPNKTWAGFFGGMAGAGLLGWLAAEFFLLGSPFTWLGIPLGAIGAAGDLFESWLKRRASVKDSGRLLPGHGGVLDRLDALLATATATMLVLMAGLWTAA